MNLFNTMHWLDLTLLGILVVGAILGLMSGVVRQIVRLVSYLGSVYATTYLHDPVVEFMRSRINVDDLLNDTPDVVGTTVPRAVCFSFTLVIVYLIVFIMTHLVQRWIKTVLVSQADQHAQTAVRALGLQTLDRLAGAAIGVAMAGVLAGVALLGLALYPDERVQASVAGSKFQRGMLKGAQSVLYAIPQKHKDELNQAVARLERAALNVGSDVGSLGFREATDRITSASSKVEQIRERAHNLATGSEDLAKQVASEISVPRVGLESPPRLLVSLERCVLKSGGFF